MAVEPPVVMEKTYSLEQLQDSCAADNSYGTTTQSFYREQNGDLMPHYSEDGQTYLAVKLLLLSSKQR
jgi:hypothetical protein